jgi:hypothetical protein
MTSLSPVWNCDEIKKAIINFDNCINKHKLDQLHEKTHLSILPLWPRFYYELFNAPNAQLYVIPYICPLRFVLCSCQVKDWLKRRGVSQMYLSYQHEPPKWFSPAALIFLLRSEPINARFVSFQFIISGFRMLGELYY